MLTSGICVTRIDKIQWPRGGNGLFNIGEDVSVGSHFPSIKQLIHDRADIGMHPVLNVQYWSD